MLTAQVENHFDCTVIRELPVDVKYLNKEDGYWKIDLLNLITLRIAVLNNKRAKHCVNMINSILKR